VLDDALPSIEKAVVSNGLRQVARLRSTRPREDETGKDDRRTGEPLGDATIAKRVAGGEARTCSDS